MRKTALLVYLPVVAMLIVTAYVYPLAPEQIPSHWNAAGVINGYSSKPLGLFLIPVLSLLLASMFLVLPRIDPLHANYEKFYTYYIGLIVVFEVFFLAFQGLILASALGIPFQIDQLLAPMMGGMFIYLGMMLGKAKRNWFVGIRTPWTLSSEEVWDRTHEVGGRLFLAAGIVSMLGFFSKEYALLLILTPVLAVAIFSVVYSYYLYQKVESRGNIPK